MPAQWTGEFVGELHNKGITAKEFAAYLGMHPKYVSRVLNGNRTPKGAEQKFRTALAEMVRDRG